MRKSLGKIRYDFKSREIISSTGNDCKHLLKSTNPLSVKDDNLQSVNCQIYLKIRKI